MGASISGLTADARVLSRFLRNECLNERYTYNQPLPVKKLVSNLGNKMQVSEADQSATMISNDDHSSNY